MTAFTFAGLSFPRVVAILPKGSLASRLAARKNRVCGPYTVASTPNTPGAFFYLDSDFMPGLRWTWADETDARIEHRGWFSDTCGDGDKIRGIVFRLPKGRGFLAGWSMGESMASELETSRVYDDERSAAYAADSMAEGVAEKEREYQAASDAGREWAEAGETIAEARREALAILKERRAALAAAGSDSAFFALCDVIRDKVAALAAEIRDAREKREALAAGEGGEYVSFWPGESRLANAFNESAGRVVIA